jgi:hypothetical protein
VYRRALAPMMLASGCLGVIGGAGGVLLPVDRPSTFLLYWMSIAAGGLLLAFALVRRQSLKAAEPFWTPPARRVAQAVLPPLAAGFLFTLGAMRFWRENTLFITWIVPLWMLCYGCALHAAGFFMPRGMKLFGWILIAAGAGLLGYMAFSRAQELPVRTLHLIMGASFGLLQLAYGVYLHFTEKPADAA